MECVIVIEKANYAMIPIETYKLPTTQLFLKKILKGNKNKNKIFYHGLYFGEEERNIICEHPFIQKFLKLKNQNQNQKTSSENSSFHTLPPILQIDHLNSLYEYFHQNLGNLHEKESAEYIFLNTESPTSSSIESNDDGFINSFLKKYHESLFELYENQQIHKICYQKNVQWIYSSNTNTNISQNIHPSILSIRNQFFLLSSFIIIFLIICLFLYLYSDNKNYLFLMILVTSWKLPLLLHKFKNDFFEAIPHLFQHSSGKIIYEDEDVKNIDENDICYFPINPTLFNYHYSSFPVQSEFPILNSIIQKTNQINQNNIKYIIPIYTYPQTKKEISFYLKNHSQTTTVIGKPINISELEQLQTEIQRLTSKYLREDV